MIDSTWKKSLNCHLFHLDKINLTMCLLVSTSRLTARESAPSTECKARQNGSLVLVDASNLLIVGLALLCLVCVNGFFPDYLWDAGQSMYFDYDTLTGLNPPYETVTCFWPMWAGISSEDQAARMMSRALPKFEVNGGLVAGTEASRGKVGLDRPSRQWVRCAVLDLVQS
jgi:hypothetical protein